MRERLLAIAVAIGLAGPALLEAQAVHAELAGVATDAAGLPLPLVSITVTSLLTGAARTTTTGADGAFVLVALPPGDYRLEADRPGLGTAVHEPLRLTAGERSRVEVALAVSVRERVAVVAAVPVLRTESGSLAHVVDSRQVPALPLNGRNVVQLAALAPGVSLPPGSMLPRINGGRPRTNEYLFDGISVLQPEPGQIAVLPIVETIQELRVVTNSPPAELGRFNGGVVAVTTRGGSNEPHATAFEFFRHEALNARNAFAPRSAGSGTPRFRRHQFGAAGGGPLRRSRVFYFGGYQGSLQQIARVRIATVPTRLQRLGLFTEPVGGALPLVFDPATTRDLGPGMFVRDPFPGSAIPIERMDPIALALLQRYPMPTTPGTANNYRRIGTETENQHQADARLDFNLSASARLFGRYSARHTVTTPVAPLPDGSGALAGALGPTRMTGNTLIGNYVQPWGARTVNELRAGRTGRTLGRSGVTRSGSAFEAALVRGLPPNAAFNDALPEFTIAGYEQLGSPPNANSRFATRVYQVLDVISTQRGRHLIKAGFDWRWQHLDVVQPSSPGGSYGFTALLTDLPGRPGTGHPLASFLLGQVQSFAVDIQQKPLRPRAMSHDYFVQDDWRAGDRLTLNLGLRYTLNFPSIEADDQGAIFNLATQELQYLGRNGFPRSARTLRKDNFGPRLGLAFRPDRRTVVRSGYGIVWIELAGITTPFINPQFPFVQTLTQRSLDGITPAFQLAAGPGVAPVALDGQAGLGQGVFTVDRDLGSGYVQQWNAAVQREIAWGTSIELAYAGSKITRAGVPDTNINQLSAGQLALGAALLEPVPNPLFGVVPPGSSIGGPTVPRAQLLKPYPAFTTVSFYRNNVGNSHYHAGQLRVEKRVSRGLAFGVSYTRSRLVDDASSVFDATLLTGPVASYPVADSFNRRLERDVSNGDTPNSVAASFVMELPWHASRGFRGALLNGWSVAGVITAQSGMPLAVTQATNHNSFAGFGVQRPNRLRDPQLPAGQRSAARWFDVGAFETAPQFTLGSSSRNPVRGPAFRNVDLAVTRRLAIRRASLELRAEAFNLLNTPALGAPNTVLGTPGFGSIASAADPRVAQLAVKVSF